MEELVTKRDIRQLLNKICFWILLGVTFLVPLFFIPANFMPTQFATSLVFAFGVIAVVLIYIISGLIYGSLYLPKPSKYIISFIVLVPVVYTLAGIANGFSRLSFFGYTFDIGTVGFILLCFAYLFLISILFREKNRIFYSYFAIFISSLLVALNIIIRMIFGPGVLSFGIFNSITQTVIGTWNNVGIFFGIIVLLSLLTLEMLKTSPLLKVILFIALLVSLFFLALVNFTTIWIIIAVSTFLFILYSLFSSQSMEVSWKNRFRRIPIYVVVIFFVAIIFSVWPGSIGGFLSTKFNITNIEVRPSLSVTLNIAKNTISSRPLFGSGPNSFVTQWLQYKPDEVLTTIFWNTDFTNGIGLVPTFAVTTGIIGVLAWLLFIGFYIYLGIKSIFSKTEDYFVKYLIVSSFFVSIYLWILTFVYVPSVVILVLTFFFSAIFLAALYLSGIIPTEEKVFSLHPRSGFVYSLVMIVFLIGGVTLGYGLVENSMSLWYFQKSAYELNTVGSPQLSEEYMNKAIAAVPTDVYYRALSEIDLAELNQVVSQDTSKITQSQLQKQFNDTLGKAIKAGLAAKDYDSTNYLNWVSLGRVYEAVSPTQFNISGAYESAGLAYSEALRRDPKNPAILLMLARLAAERNDLTTARNNALQAISVKNNYLDAYFLLTQIAVANNNISEAIQAATASSVINPTDPAIFFQLGLLKYNVSDFKGAIEAFEKATSMTPDYANAKYFLGLSYEATKQHDKAIKEFEDLTKTNPDSKEVQAILANLEAGKPIFTSAQTKPEKGKSLPVKEAVQ